MNLTSLITTLISLDSTNNHQEPSIFFNISIHAPFVQLNRIFFSLFVCGALTDTDSGLAFSLSNDRRWTFIIEVPHAAKDENIRENFNQILPVLSLMNWNKIEEVTEENYKLDIGTEEEVVARFLKANENQTINRLYVETTTERDSGLLFAELKDKEECRHQIHACMLENAQELKRNKICELSFVKFLYRRVRFFTDSAYYRFNDHDECLGSRAMKQMISEAINLSQMDFHHDGYPRVFLVYDPGFSLFLLHTGWDQIPTNVKEIFKKKDPAKREEFRDKNYFVKCLSWVLDIGYDEFIDVIKETRFILTENFTYKLFHIHERKLTKLPLIIEGHTGVGKTYLLKFYSMLLNVKVMKDSLDYVVAPPVQGRLSVWLRKSIIEGILVERSNLYNVILKQIQAKLAENNNQMNEPELVHPQFYNGEENENDDEDLALEAPAAEVVLDDQVVDAVDEKFVEKFKSSLSNHSYDNTQLKLIWKTIINITHDMDSKTCQLLDKYLYEHIAYHITNYPLMTISYKLEQLLDWNSTEWSPLNSIKIFNEYLLYTKTKSLFYRLLLHPGISEEQLEDFMKPICELAKRVPKIELVIFFDEVNTSSCLGLFKEMFMDGTLNGQNLPKNIFFTSAINPASTKQDDEKAVHRIDYLVHQLPQALEHLKIRYNTLDSPALRDYISQKIATFTLPGRTQTSLDNYVQEMLTGCIVDAQEFCEKYLGNREFLLISSILH